MTRKILRLFLPYLLPKAIAWINGMEAQCLTCGRWLSPDQKLMARTVGVKDINRVRLLVVKNIPLPISWWLRVSGTLTRLFSRELAALTAGYGIWVRSDSISDELIMHELVHVAQYERLGGIDKFLERYLDELIEHGYADMPLEVEAREA